MQFSGEITPEIEEEFRNLYYKRHPGFIILYACLVYCPARIEKKWGGN